VTAAVESLSHYRREWAAEPLLPVVAGLEELVPGLRRGSAVSVEGGAGATSLLFALAAGPSRDGGWCAAVGLPTLGAQAAADAGMALDRLVAVPRPGRQWAAVVAALLDGVDLVLLAPPAGGYPERDVRRLSARARERGAVLLSRGNWPGAALRLTVTGCRWDGIGAGHGHLRGRELELRVDGRGAAARTRRLALRLDELAEEGRTA
jgi:hypothetical protein